MLITPTSRGVIVGIATHPLFRAIPLLFGLLAIGCRQSSPEPIAAAPAFELTDQHNRSFGSKQLANHPYVIAFIFTRCPTICPTITMHMSDLAIATEGQDLEFVSVTVDPEYDTALVLNAWSKKWPINPARWHLLTGTQAQIEATSSGFMQGLQALEAEGDVPNIAHSERLILVDGNGQILGLPHASTDGVQEVISLLSKVSQ